MDKKKDWREGGFSTLLGDTPALKKGISSNKPKRGRPKTSTKVITPGNTPEDGTKQGERRATYIVKIEHIDNLEAVAYWERKKIKEVIGEAIQEYINRYEKKNGKLKPKPKK